MKDGDVMTHAETAAPGASAILADFAAGLQFEDLPPEVVDHLKLAVLDGLACCLHGATLPWTRMVAELADADGGTPEASLIGMLRMVPVANAVLVNATAGHAFEMDDIHRDAITHPNSIAVPVALNMGERLMGSRKDGVPGSLVLTAIAAGYEVACRVGAAAGTDLLLRGFHPQGTVGPLVAAATAARMMGLDAAQTAHALGIAGSLGAGLMAAQEGAMVKRLHSGRAAEAGVRGAELAAKGFTGISDMVEAEYGGFLAAFAGTNNIDRAVRGLMPGQTMEWEILQTGFKPHATVTSIHAALDCLKAVMADNGIGADEVEGITAHISHPTYVHCAWPYKAQGITAAQMNLYYGLAMIALDGEAFTAQFTEDRIKDAKVLAFIERIDAKVDPEIEAEGPGARHMARITLHTKDGRTFSHTERNRRGSPENPVTAQDLDRKYHALAEPVIGADKAARVKAFVADLDRVADIRPLMCLLTA
ncbi:MAG: MmgE/PrpD family protein [Rhodospirillales bacterium]